MRWTIVGVVWGGKTICLLLTLAKACMILWAMDEVTRDLFIPVFFLAEYLDYRKSADDVGECDPLL